MAEMESWLKHKIDYLPPSDDESAIVNGRIVPNVTVQHLSEGRLTFKVGLHRFTCDIFDGEAILGLVADAVAVGAGYVSWPQEGEEFIKRPFAPGCFIVTSATTEDGETVDLGGAPND